MTDSVAKLAIRKVRDRLLLIDGTGNYRTDLGGRVYLASRQVAEAPAVSIFRDTEEREAQSTDRTQKILTLRLEGVVYANQIDPGAAIEDLYADIEQALEDPADLYLEHNGENLVQAMVITGTDVADRLDSSDLEGIAIVLQLDFPHRYGDPTFIF